MFSEINGEFYFKVICEAHKIPDGTTVTKKAGTKEYTLTRSLKLYYNKGTQSDSGSDRGEVKMGGDCVMLIDGTDAVSVVSGDTELVAYITYDQMANYIDEVEGK